ncbi:GDSL-type esterase/lipase family protein [Roseimaritima ulvae]|uniref:GDSL-like Lipase/Acylhydrolase n=1 Tax=Roseimaritima ulvae TaxID=980254 RepID=A0A5B9R1Q8_9BACT|nr:GDSL-type esterase/lipase family protein [Roseimaritima ulvae]QEG43745.1 GDSL-like Lipase/Acylhydrolase [Roseimaritima ulvae]
MAKFFMLFVAPAAILLTSVLPAQDVAAPAETAPAATLALPETDEGLPGSGPIRRYGWFKKLWDQRRGVWAQRIEQDQNAVVFFGDSITQGWGDHFHGAFPNLKKANRGISGDTTRGLLLRLDRDVMALNPAAIVLLIGTNDLEEKAEPQTIADDFALLLKNIRAQSDVPVIVCNVFPSSASKSRPADKIQEINKLYAKVAQQHDHVTVLDTWTLFADEQGNAKREEFPDLLHPNGEGYAKWVAALRPLFATLGLIETEPTTFEPEPGFEMLYNGKDLSGWGFRPKGGEVTAFDGRQASPDGRYVAIGDRIVVTTPREGRRVQQMWTTRKFPGDFVLKLEFRATPNADSGVFIRKPQLQCRDYPLAGPYKDLKNYKPQDWNELVITVVGDTAHCTCNGEVLEAALKLPKTGPIGLEGDRGQMEYRRIRIQTGS